MPTHTADVAVLGTGPGGYVAAIRCAQLGLSVVAVEDDRPGGVCLNWGCIPTKALLRNAEVVHLFHRAAEFGIRVTGFEADYAEAVRRSRRVADRMAKGVEFLFRKNKITLVSGRGRLLGPTTIEVATAGESERIEARAVIVATGAEPKSLPGVTIDEERVMFLQWRRSPRAGAQVAHHHRRRCGGGGVRRRLQRLRYRGHPPGGSAACVAHRGRGSLDPAGPQPCPAGHHAQNRGQGRLGQDRSRGCGGGDRQRPPGGRADPDGGRGGRPGSQASGSTRSA